VQAYDQAMQKEGTQIPLALCNAIEASRGQPQVEWPPTREQCLQAQRDLCAEHGWPDFGPTHTGICFACKHDIVTGYEEHWFSHITCCPRCFKSYCD
jgi:hypothetical protein